MSMNKVIEAGVRLTADPEVRYSVGDNPMAIASFRVAANRRGKREEGSQEADFIPCKAFGKTAEFIEKYLRKGTKVNLEGRLTSGSFTNKDGVKVYTLEVTVEDIEFAESKSSNGGGETPAQQPSSNSGNGFMNIPEGIDEAAFPFK